MTSMGDGTWRVQAGIAALSCYVAFVCCGTTMDAGEDEQIQIENTGSYREVATLRTKTGQRAGDSEKRKLTIYRVRRTSYIHSVVVGFEGPKSC